MQRTTLAGRRHMPMAVAYGQDHAPQPSHDPGEPLPRSKQGWLRRLLALHDGIPSHETSYRVFARLDPKEFGVRVAEWLTAACEATKSRHIAIDEKAVRAVPEAALSGWLRLVTAWAAENRLILSQQVVADGSSESPAIPELLNVLDLHGA